MRHRHAHRSRSDNEQDREEDDERDEALTPEERAFEQARRRANAQVGFLSHAVAYGAVCFFLLFVAGFKAAFIVALAWGIGLASHFFGALVAPDLRRHYIAREVERQVQHSAPRERRNLEERHVRSLEELSASIAHEIRNPITAAKSLVQQMGEDPSSAENVEYAKVALEELDRVERSVAHLLRFAREEEMRMADLRLADVISSAVATLRERATSRGVALDVQVGVDCALRGDAEKLRRVLINLLANALDALEGAGVQKPRIEVTAGENLAGTECWVRVRDNGPGIAPESLSKIFSPFYTSKEGGTGLGLAISKKLVDAHGGSIEAQSTPGAGAEFTVAIPKRAVRS
ncbi:MAG TPA: HAMP domain-containing sensor histidine kinase [Myxococcota bacterium]|nr:HAMP domain-containing sensor histidine kinase [Myxococcota bacterium]